ncbi:MAG TPA: SDR family oxidoreductase [Candidatus Woesebacteria bacterium]|nr:SDR family oxidoreductase [Candidatus Woesebacteria bacterium]
MKIDQIFGLEDKTVMITGASSGIGRATAKLFSECGCKVSLVDINMQGMIDTAEQLAQPTKHETSLVDLSKKESIDGLWGNLKETPDILVNNAGSYPSQDFLKMTEEEYQKTVDVNLNSMVWMCRQFIARRKKMGGVIVNVGSIEAILPFKKHLVPYSVSKAAVIALTRSLARDYGRAGIRANVVLPGAIMTPGTMSQVWNGLFHARVDLMRTADVFSSRLALGRWGKPEEVAKVIVFLASDMASYIQGALIPVDGGFLSS